MIIEARPYGPDSTPEELEALLRRLSFHGNATVLYREVPVMSEFQLDLFFDRVEELFRVHDCSFLIVDLSEGSRPDARMRAKIKERSSGLEGQLLRMAVVTTNNILIRVAAKFVAATLPMSMSLSVHDTLAEAEEAIRRAST